MAISKKTFVALAERKIEMFNDFSKALDSIKELVKKYNNKVINKRFLDKANEIIKNVTPDVTLYFDTNWSGERTNRFVLRHGNRWVKGINAYVENSSYEFYIYPLNGSEEYIDKENGWRMIEGNCLKAIDKEMLVCEDKVSDLKECISRVDEVYDTYVEMDRYIKEKTLTLPRGLRVYQSINNPLYND